MYLKNQSQVRFVQWGTTDLWDIKIDGMPEPFSGWFPATDVTITNLSGNTFDVHTPHASFSIPSSRNNGDLNITTLDDVNRTIYIWYRDLLDKIYGDTYVLPLEESIVKINIIQLDQAKQVISHIEYECLPSGNSSWTGSSTRNITNINLEFKIVNKKVISERKK